MLASASPRRKELLGFTGLDFETWTSDVDETPLAAEDPADFCQRLSREKAQAGSLKHPGTLIIAADTIVVLEGRILGKPADAEQAKAYLRSLSGRTHEVMTGYTVLDTVAGQTISRVVKTAVSFKRMSEAEIEWYVASGEPMDKAGAYAIQGSGGLFIERIDGSHSNVVGLPLAEIYSDLKSFGLTLAQPN
ncbi:MAG: Maf-like protein YhdE [Deltaproteobacteria bacterium ADurb.Bin510]|nr:MAG: Maf-like protein YhdE [Deltaproteobacteria bacterium ADurb.Bin510]